MLNLEVQVSGRFLRLLEVKYSENHGGVGICVDIESRRIISVDLKKLKVTRDQLTLLDEDPSEHPNFGE
jgi:hypothetical protein